ncbi:hypothetical protein [Lysobacter xanthus]
MTRPLAALLLALAFAPFARADPFAFLDLGQAQAALARLDEGDVVHLYCAPCGETRSRRMTVRAPGIDRVRDRRGSAAVYRDPDGLRYWVVQANDASLDLAYVYVRDGRRWRNLAIVLGLDAQRVPAALPNDAIGSDWQCQPDYGSPYLGEPGRRDPCARR